MGNELCLRICGKNIFSICEIFKKCKCLYIFIYIFFFFPQAVCLMLLQRGVTVNLSVKQGGDSSASLRATSQEFRRTPICLAVVLSHDHSYVSLTLKTKHTQALMLSHQTREKAVLDASHNYLSM